MFEWGQGRNATVIIQPKERTSGVDISMDGKRTGSKPTQQSRMSGRQTAQDVGGMLGQLGGMLGGGGSNPNGGGGLGGLGGMLGL